MKHTLSLSLSPPLSLSFSLSRFINGSLKFVLQDNDWWTPLHAASACGHWRVASFLLTHGADVTAVNSDGDLAIDIAEGDRVVELLREEMDRLGILRMVT